MMELRIKVFDMLVEELIAAGYDLSELLPPQVWHGQLGQRESLRGTLRKESDICLTTLRYYISYSR